MKKETAKNIDGEDSHAKAIALGSDSESENRKSRSHNEESDSSLSDNYSESGSSDKNVSDKVRSRKGNCLFICTELSSIFCTDLCFGK